MTKTEEKEDKPNHTQVIQATASVTLANIPLAKESHLAEPRAKGTGILSCPKWETTAKLHGPIMYLRRSDELESTLKSTTSIIWREKRKILARITSETKESLEKVKDYV